MGGGAGGDDGEDGRGQGTQHNTADGLGYKAGGLGSLSLT